MFAASPRSLFATLSLALLLCAGCGNDDRPRQRKGKTKTASIPLPGAGNKVAVGKNISLEVLPQSKRVLIEATVCLRSGTLEQLLTLKQKKEHEAILALDGDARQIHKALLLAGAKPGAPVRFDPEFQPASGSKIRITLVYNDGEQLVTVNARSWVRQVKTNKELDSDWVFAGSQLAQNPLDPTAPKHYLASEGDVICISNYEGALLDLPILSSKGDDDRSYEAWTERIPKVGTKVTMVLEIVK